MKMSQKVFTIDLIGESVGPKIGADATPEQLSDKIQQQINAYLLFGHLFAKEDLPLFPQYENDIKRVPIAAAIYSYCFMKKPWPEAEKVIAKEKEASMLYAGRVLRSRFPAGEEAISSDPEYCLAYSLFVLKRGKLPDFMHNKMLLHAIKDPDNKHVKRYLKFKKVRRG
jgi:hypothetical protein